MFSSFRKACIDLTGEHATLLERSKFADLALPCFKLSDNPVNKAKELSELYNSLLANSKSKMIKEIKANGPYVNFYINEKSFSLLVLKAILKQRTLYGSGKKKGAIVVLEHTSMNPSGPIHVGRLRNSIIGDSLRRILQFNGYKVETHYFVNDIGKQIAIISWGLMHEIRPSRDLINLYQAYKNKPDFKTMFLYVPSNDLVSKSEEKMREVENIIQKCESSSSSPPELKTMKNISSTCLKGQIALLKRLGIVFDRFDFESDYINSAKEMPQKLRLKGKLKEQDGAIGIDLSEYGLRDFAVLARKDGTTVYLARDLAYHSYKMQRGDIIINVLGEDHKIEAQELSMILKMLGTKKCVNNFHYSFVNFRGMRLSTRMGQIAPLDALIDEGIEKAKREIKKRGVASTTKAKHIAIAAIKYHMIKTTAEKNITFIWEDALNFEGDTGPYLQYTYARAQSILNKSGKKPGTKDLNNIDMNIVKLLSFFPEVVENAAKNPHDLAKYLHELAAQFNTFYHSTRVIDSDYEPQLLALVKATTIVMKNGLSLLGIAALDNM